MFVQKGGIPGFVGCLEHTSVEARDNKGELSVVWLDLTNAYGSIAHKLIAETLTRYHVPNEIQNMLAQYYERFYIRFNADEKTQIGKGWRKAWMYYFSYHISKYSESHCEIC